MKVNYTNLKVKKKNQKKYIKIFSEVLSDGEYVGGKYINLFEKNIANYCGSKYAVALNSGTDALTLALFACGVKKGDEIITIPNSFIASVAAIVHIGAKPIFVDVLNDQNIDPKRIEKKITKKTKVIMPVHLTGRVSRMDEIMKIANKHGIKVIEDAAQSIGAKYKNKLAGTFGKVGCFSAHPLKNLASIGDSGYLITNDKKIYNKIKLLRNHGIENRNLVKHFGYVSRLDNLKAAVLNYRLKNLNIIIKKRRKIAKFYFKNINNKKLILPYENQKEFNTYHTFVIQVKNNERNKLQKYLQKNKIETKIHYPIPIHLQPAAKRFNYKKGDFVNTEKQCRSILSIPVNEQLRSVDIKKICYYLNKF